MANLTKYTTDDGRIVSFPCRNYAGAQPAGNSVEVIVAKRARHAVIGQVKIDNTGVYDSNHGSFKIYYPSKALFDAISVGSQIDINAVGNNFTGLPPEEDGYQYKFLRVYPERLKNTVIRGS